jgi:tol-pal system protein YbgF
LARCIARFAATWLVLGCAHRGPDQAQVAELNHKVESLRLQNAEYAKQVEELENRVFILTDQLESRKVNEQRVATPLLPTVKLHPEPEVAQVPQEMTPATTMVGPEADIEYAGEAARPSSNRPVLRLHGDQGSARIEHVAEHTENDERPARAPRESQGSSGRAARGSEADAIKLYRQSFQILGQGKHDEAAEGFRELLRRFPNHDLADNAQYWLGECSYDRKDYSTAVREFRRVVERFPRGNKVPDALLKIGFSYLALGSTEAGKQTLVQLVRSYPRHEAATLAAARLAELERTGAALSSPSAHPSLHAKTTHVPQEAP